MTVSSSVVECLFFRLPWTDSGTKCSRKKWMKQILGSLKSSWPKHWKGTLTVSVYITCFPWISTSFSLMYMKTIKLPQPISHYSFVSLLIVLVNIPYVKLVISHCKELWINWIRPPLSILHASALSWLCQNHIFWVALQLTMPVGSSRIMLLAVKWAYQRLPYMQNKVRSQNLIGFYAKFNCYIA